MLSGPAVVSNGTKGALRMCVLPARRHWLWCGSATGTALTLQAWTESEPGPLDAWNGGRRTVDGEEQAAGCHSLDSAEGREELAVCQLGGVCCVLGARRGGQWPLGVGQPVCCEL